MLYLISQQVLNGIQTGPYKNIYNPENFFVGKNGLGAANNWGDGYQTGELVHEEVMEMIDREADGSDSLEVSRAGIKWKDIANSAGLHDASLDRWRNRIWFGVFSFGKTE